MRKKIAEILYVEDTYLGHASKILALIRKEIKKVGKLKMKWQKNPKGFTIDDYLKLYDEEGLMGVIEKASEQAAQAQFQKILKALEEK